jgi:hypothetical protein
MSYHLDDIPVILSQFDPKNCRTWPFTVLTMPLKDGKGPVSDKECDALTWEVWDLFFDSYGSYEHLPDAINKCLDLNHQLLILREVPVVD